MCGIIGGWVDGGLSSEAIDESLQSIIHRGPDGRGLLVQFPAFLGMRRLAIIDLDGGQQPIYNEDHSVALVCNGEIYNEGPLRRQLLSQGHHFSTGSDTEVLVHLYEDIGNRLCERLRGMFGFAIWDANARRLLLGRDRFGKKPLYYSRTSNGGLLFATELKALRPLIEATGGLWTIRNQAIYDYLSLGCVPQPETAFNGVCALPPGSTLSFDGHDLRINKYWQIDYQRKTRLSYREVLEQTRESVGEAVRVRLRSDVPLGVFLSGGVDSTVVAYEAAKKIGPSLHTFTISVDDEQYDESAIAARTAREFDVRNTVLKLRVAPLEALQKLVRQYDQPFADPSAIPSMAIAELARQHVTVVLNGDGGDEIFAGYRRHLATHYGRWLKHLPARLTNSAGGLLSRLGGNRRSAAGFAARLLRGAASSPGSQFLTWTFDRLYDGDKRPAWLLDDMRPTEEWIESRIPSGLSPLDAQTSAEIDINLLSDLLVKMDIATMAHSLEARSPLLDHQLAEFVASLPAGYRIRGRQLKSPLRDAYRGLIPTEVIRAKKRGFEIPLKAWLEGELAELLHDTLGSPSALLRNFLDGNFVDGIVSNQTLMERNWPTMVYSLLVLELWLQEQTHMSVEQSKNGPARVPGRAA